MTDVCSKKQVGPQDESELGYITTLVDRAWFNAPSNDEVPETSEEFPRQLVAAVPRMPRAKTGTKHSHREKEGIELPQCPIAVSRQLTKKEYVHNEAAQKAIQAEAKKLRNKKTWLEDHVREWSDVSREARESSGKDRYKATRANIFLIVHEKNSHLPEGHPSRAFKARFVYQGNAVKDENADVALFNELSSSPAHIGAARFALVYGALKGHLTQSRDAKQAYTQALLGKEVVVDDNGQRVTLPVQTWVRLPPEIAPPPSPSTRTR